MKYFIYSSFSKCNIIYLLHFFVLVSFDLFHCLCISHFLNNFHYVFFIHYLISCIKLYIKFKKKKFLLSYYLFFFIIVKNVLLYYNIWLYEYIIIRIKLNSGFIFIYFISEIIWRINKLFFIEQIFHVFTFIIK